MNISGSAYLSFYEQVIMLQVLLAYQCLYVNKAHILLDATKFNLIIM